MGRINSNIASVIAQANLNRSQNELQVRLERLSTGLQINRGKDDPAGLIISERIRSDIQGINQGIKNSDRASSMISTTEASLAEVNDLLNSIRGLIVQSANTGANSQAERDANQLQIDSAIDSITRISNTASFGGLKLLNGSLDYRLSGVRSSAITTVSVKNAQFVNANALQIEVDVISSAQVGALYYNGGTTPPGVTLSAITLEVKGSRGVEVLSLPSGQSLAQVVTAVNKISTLTGVTARLINAADANSGMVFASEGYGSDSMVSVRRQGAPSPDPFTLYKFSEAAMDAITVPAANGTPSSQPPDAMSVAAVTPSDVAVAPIAPKIFSISHLYSRFTAASTPRCMRSTRLESYSRVIMLSMRRSGALRTSSTICARGTERHALSVAASPRARTPRRRRARARTSCRVATRSAMASFSVGAAGEGTAPPSESGFATGVHMV